MNGMNGMGSSSLSNAQFGGSLQASAGLGGPLGSSGMPGAIGNSSAGMTGTMSGGMGAGGLGY